MHKGIVMPILQVRDLPEDLYIKLNMIANEENRSIAQQAIMLLKESMSLHFNHSTIRDI